MVYLDYSASTPVSKSVLEKFNNDNFLYVGNANSMHKLGEEINKKLDECSSKVLKLLGLDASYELVYTSGASEANNLAILGMFEGCKDGVIISSSTEHSSVIAPIGRISKNGVKVVFCNPCSLEEVIKENTGKKILVSFAAVNSEAGIVLNLDEVKNICNRYDNVTLHIDATQGIGKVKLNYNDVDMISLSSHKFYGIKGVGCLIKKKSVCLKKQIVGGKSLSKYRSGTVSHPLVFSLCYALEDAISNIDSNINKVNCIYEYLISRLNEVEGCCVNKFEDGVKSCVKHIVNISFKNTLSKDMVMYLSSKDIYISSYTACSSDMGYSKTIYELTADMEKAETCVRVSLSHLTTKDEIDYLIKALKER